MLLTISFVTVLPKSFEEKKNEIELINYIALDYLGCHFGKQDRDSTSKNVERLKRWYANYENYQLESGNIQIKARQHQCRSFWWFIWLLAFTHSFIKQNYTFLTTWSNIIFSCEIWNSDFPLCLILNSCR